MRYVNFFMIFMKTIDEKIKNYVYKDTPPWSTKPMENPKQRRYTHMNNLNTKQINKLKQQVLL